MTPDEKLSALEKAFEAAMIEAMRATDGAGLKIILLPSATFISDPIRATCIPTCGELRARIIDLVGKEGEVFLGYRAEEAAARNVTLLAKVWEAAVRYWDFKREIDK